MNPPASEQLYLRCLSYLEREEALQEQLLEFAQTMRQCLVQGDLNRLQTIIRSGAELWRVRGELDHERRQLVSEASLLLRFDPGQKVRLRDIAGELPSPWREQLLERAGRLRDTVEQIDEINAGNALLLQHHRQLLNQVLYYLTGERCDQGCYSPLGTESPGLTGVLIRAQG